MGFRTVQKQTKRKKKIALCIIFSILAFLVAAVFIFSCIVPVESWKYHFSLPKPGKRKEGELRVHFLDVGQGDSTIIELPDGKVMLVDGGNGSSKTARSVLRYLNALKIKEIDYLVATHTDRDHCGAFDEVFKYKSVLNAYMPTSFSEYDVEFAEAYAAALEEGCSLVAPSRSVDLSVTEGEYPYALRFLYPYAEDAAEGTVEGGETSSAVLWLEYRGTGILLCGDAPVQTEEKLMQAEMFLQPLGVDLTSTEIFKVSHHGSKDANSAAFLAYLGVKTAVISCGKNNGYQHPSGETLNRLAAVGAEVYRTDAQGHIRVTVGKEGGYAVKALG